MRKAFPAWLAARAAALLSLAAFLWLAAPAQARELSLAEISAYLNGLKVAEARFRQFNDDGSISTGTLYIRRPGRMRFEYDPPEKSLVMAGQGQVAVFDPKSNQPPERFPLVRTPLNLILAEKVDLGRDKFLLGHFSDGKTTSIVAQDPKHPDYGNIQLVFSADPITLRQWIVTDSAGQKTVVVLDELKLGGSYRASLFSIEDEMRARGF